MWKFEAITQGFIGMDLVLAPSQQTAQRTKAVTPHPPTTIPAFGKEMQSYGGGALTKEKLAHLKKKTKVTSWDMEV